MKNKVKLKEKTFRLKIDLYRQVILGQIFTDFP